MCPAQFFWTGVAGVGIFVQLWTGHAERKDLATLNLKSWFGRTLFTLHRWFHLLLDVEDSMAEHSDPHSVRTTPTASFRSPRKLTECVVVPGG